MYSINFTENNKKFCLSLHYKGANCCLFVNGTEVHKFKAKDSEIVSKDFPLDNTKKTGINGYVHDFSACSWWYIRHSQVFNEKKKKKRDII